MSAFEGFPVFIDVGASVGRVWRSWLAKAPAARIYAFEPNQELFSKMKEYQKPNVKLFEMAVSTQDNPNGVPFYIANDKNSSSLYKFNDSHVRDWKYPPGRRAFKTVKETTVPTMRLDTLIRNEEIKYVDFLKIDTQGHDLEVLKSLGKSITKVREIMIEVSLTPFDIYEGQTNKKDAVVDYLKRYGFGIHKEEKLSRNQEANMWFINNRFGRISRNKFYHFDMPR